MTTALQAPHPARQMQKGFFLPRRRGVPSTYIIQEGTDRTMETAHPEIVGFSRAADARRRGALRSGENGRRS